MIRLALLDDDLAGLRRLLEADRGLEILAAAPDPATLARHLDGRRPDVLVLEYDPVRGEALELCWRLKCRAGAPRVLLYTAHVTPALAIAARAAGFDGLVGKGVSAPVLSAAIRRVAAGESVLPTVLHHDFEDVVERLADEDLATFALLLDDVDAQDVAARLRLSEHDADRRVLRVLNRIRPRRQREPR